MQKLSASHLQSKVFKSGIYILLQLINPHHDTDLNFEKYLVFARQLQGEFVAEKKNITNHGSEFAPKREGFARYGHESLCVGNFRPWAIQRTRIRINISHGCFRIFDWKSMILGISWKCHQNQKKHKIQTVLRAQTKIYSWSGKNVFSIQVR